MNTIDVYFDFISPYSYLAAPRIRKLAARHNREVRWRPFRLGVTVVKVMGLRPVAETPLKGAYATEDVRRLATVLGEPFCFEGILPDPRPAAMFVHSAPQDSVPALVDGLLRAQWADGRDIGSIAVLEQVGRQVGLDRNVVREALTSPKGATRLKQTTEEAIARGVFGSPTCVVGEALFWGLDRLWLLDAFLEGDEEYLLLSRLRAKALAVDLTEPTAEDFFEPIG